MATRPGRRTSQLEFVVALTLLACFAGWWAQHFASAQADVRILQVRETAGAMRMLSRELHLAAVVANQPDVSGALATPYGLVEMQRGFVAATADGIGRVLAAQAPAGTMHCAAIRVPHPARADQRLDGFECAPAELAPAARERCAARYLAPLWPGDEPAITFLFHSKHAAGEPCAAD